MRSILGGGLLAVGLAAIASPASAQVEPPRKHDEQERTVPTADAQPAKGPAASEPPGGEKTDAPKDAKDKDTKPKRELVAGTGEASPKRAMPDYDGRGEPSTTAGDVALWVPRVVFAPLYFVTEYLIRRPIGWLIATAERNQWPSAIRDLFLFGPNKTAGVVPTAFLDFGVRPSVGIYAFWDDLFMPGNHLRLHASTFGSDWLQGAFADRIPLGKNATADFRLEGVHRPDSIFHGLGPRSLQNDRTRYGIDVVKAHAVFDTTWWKSSRITTNVGFKTVHFRDDICCGDPSLVLAIRDGRIAAPPGFGGYATVFERGEFTLDTRDPRPANQSGLRVELEGEHASNVRSPAGSWVRYGGSVGGFLDIKNNRIVSLSVTALFADPLARRSELPFTEQVVLGGSGPMRGYLYGRLIDRSAAVATLKYRWPIWSFLDGTIQGALGNVFGSHLENFSTRLLRVSGAIGFESVGSPDHTFEVLAGFGTETFERHAEVNSFRLLFGTNRGF